MDDTETLFDNEDSKGICASILKTLLDQRSKRVKRGFYWENQIAFVYNSEKIEGSLLTEEQTRAIFETGTIKSGKPVPIDNVFETRNHFRMFDLMLDTIDEPLTADLIKRLHYALKRSDGAGEWKTLPNGVDGITTTPPNQVEEAISRLLTAYSNRSTTGYEEIAAFHVLYERIHPFLDGNGRTGRAIMFRECLVNGLVPFIVIDAEKPTYYQALRTFDHDEGAAFVRFAERMAELYLEEFTSLIPSNLLLPSMEAYVKSPSFDALNTSYFERKNPNDIVAAAIDISNRAGAKDQDSSHGLNH